MGTDKTRRQKFVWMQSVIDNYFLKNPEKSISKSRLIAQFSAALASTERTAEEILRIFVKTKLIKIKGDEIFKGK